MVSRQGPRDGSLDFASPISRGATGAGVACKPGLVHAIRLSAGVVEQNHALTHCALGSRFPWGTLLAREEFYSGVQNFLALLL
jgi:hypothetical protein